MNCFVLFYARSSWCRGRAVSLGFSHFSSPEKSAKMGPLSGSQLSADFISSTPSAYEKAHFSEDGNFFFEEDQTEDVDAVALWLVVPPVQCGPRASVVLASAYSFWSTLYTDDHGSLWETGTGPRHASAYVCLWKNFLFYVLAQSALGWYLVHYFRCCCFWQSVLRASGYC